MTLKLVDQPRNKNPILLKKMSKKSRSKLRIIHPILSGCLQYFNTDTGLLRSFNFVPASTFGSSGLVRTSDTHLANQDYKICIQVWGILTKTHLSRCPSGLKQKCTQTLTSFLGTFFQALSHDAIHFVPRDSSKNLEMEVSDWLVKNFNTWESGFLA